MDHPVIEQIERTGYPKGFPEREIYGIDARGNEVLEGDAIIVFENEWFLKDELSVDAQEVLEILGAEEKTA